jgi:hypothetical protein
LSRDSFNAEVIHEAGRRVAHRCSNPTCRKVCIGPRNDGQKSVNIGVAAHIAAASPGGPRYDPLQTPDERAGIVNALWLCQDCGKLVDNDPARFSVAMLREWKIRAEGEAQAELGRRPRTDAEDDRLIAKLAEATTPVRNLAEIKNGLGNASLTYLTAEADVATGSYQEHDHIAGALMALPQQLAHRQAEEVGGLLQEQECQRRALAIDREFRPQVESAARLVAKTITEACARGLTSAKQVSESLVLPTQIAYTTFAMQRNAIPEELRDRTMEFQFPGNVRWAFYLKLGMVQSPAILAQPWDAPTPHYYPMLRMQRRMQRGDAQDDEMLGTIWYHQETKAVGFALNVYLEPVERAAFERIAALYKGDALIQASLIELLSLERRGVFELPRRPS